MFGVLVAMKKISAKQATAVLVLVYSVGIVGLLWPMSKPYFLLLTPLNLLLTLCLLVFYQENKNTNFWIVSVTVALLGFGSEVLGVHTGWPFGQYHYASALGWKLADVPLILAANWLILVLSTLNICQTLHPTKAVRAALAATLMVGLDTFIEPVAMRNDFWQWPNGVVATQNYVGWWVVAFGLLLLAENLPFPKRNPMAWPVYGALLYFFVAQCMAYGLL